MKSAGRELHRTTVFLPADVKTKIAARLTIWGLWGWEITQQSVKLRPTSGCQEIGVPADCVPSQRIDGSTLW